jgi:protocatechuate 4,5-dioxygenase, beta chain
MAELTTAGLSSHAFTFLPPEDWEARRAITRDRYRLLTNREPPPEPLGVAGETLEKNIVRFAAIQRGLEAIRTRIYESQPDVLVLIGDDQNENYPTSNLPQFSLYVGEEFVTSKPKTGSERRYRSPATLAYQIAIELVDAGFDIATSDSFDDEHLISHAHREPLDFLDLPQNIDVLPVFINAIHVPAPTPSRCLDLGRELRKITDAHEGVHRLAFYSSGGFSHFTAGYPWRDYQGEYTLGCIAEDFDRRVVEAMCMGRGDELRSLTSADLLANGQIELRQHLVLLGALGTARPQLFAYEPFYRAVLGMAVGLWELDR